MEISITLPRTGKFGLFLNENRHGFFVFSTHNYATRSMLCGLTSTRITLMGCRRVTDGARTRDLRSHNSLIPVSRCCWMLQKPLS
jgi:hypothetical protein